MQDSKRIKLTGRGIPLRGNDIDTDRIIPARFLRTVTFDGLGAHAFEDDRAQLRAAGKLHSFDDPRFAEGTILVVNKNFGCGSSREHAPQALARWGRGISAVVGESFAEIFFGNCIAIGVPCVVAAPDTVEFLMAQLDAHPESPLVVDLEQRTVGAADRVFPVILPDGPRQQFLEGRWDTTAELLENAGKIRDTASRIPYFRDFA